MTDPHCRIRTIRLKHGYIEESVWMRSVEAGCFLRTGYATWERIEAHQYAALLA